MTSKASPFWGFNTEEALEGAVAALLVLLAATEESTDLRQRDPKAIEQARKAVAYSAPPRERVIDGEQLICYIDEEKLFYRWPRSASRHDYECALCGTHSFPLSEEGSPDDPTARRRRSHHRRIAQ